MADSKWLLSDFEVRERSKQLDLAIATSDKLAVRRQYRWWKEFHEGLTSLLTSEIDYYLGHTDEYNMPATETDYFKHWERQHEESGAVLAGIRGVIRAWYDGQVK